MVAHRPAGAVRPATTARSRAACAAGRAGTWARTRTSPTTTRQHQRHPHLLQRLPRAAAAQGDGARLGRRPHRGGGPLPTPATARRASRRCSTTSATTPTWSATTTINLGATTLGFTAYALTGERKYRDWVLEYVDAWVERTEANGGLIPTSVGPGRHDRERLRLVRRRLRLGLLGACRSRGAGRSPTATRPSTAPHYGFANALLLTGDRRYVDLWRRMLDLVNANAQAGGRPDALPAHVRPAGPAGAPAAGPATLDDLPEKGPEGWYEFRPQQFAPGALDALLLDARPLGARAAAGDAALGPLPGRRRTRRTPRRRCRPTWRLLRRKVELHARRRPHAGHDDVGRPEPHQPGHDGALIQLMLGGLPIGPRRATRCTAGCATSTPRGAAPGCPSTSGRWWSA